MTESKVKPIRHRAQDFDINGDVHNGCYWNEIGLNNYIMCLDVNPKFALQTHQTGRAITVAKKGTNWMFMKSNCIVQASLIKGI